MIVAGSIGVGRLKVVVKHGFVIVMVKGIYLGATLG